MMERCKELLHSEFAVVDETIHNLKEEIASLKAQLLEKDRIITNLTQVRPCTFLSFPCNIFIW